MCSKALYKSISSGSPSHFLCHCHHTFHFCICCKHQKKKKENEAEETCENNDHRNFSTISDVAVNALSRHLYFRAIKNTVEDYFLPLFIPLPVLLISWYRFKLLILIIVLLPGVLSLTFFVG